MVGGVTGKILKEAHSYIAVFSQREKSEINMDDEHTGCDS